MHINRRLAQPRQLSFVIYASGPQSVVDSSVFVPWLQCTGHANSDNRVPSVPREFQVQHLGVRTVAFGGWGQLSVRLCFVCAWSILLCGTFRCQSTDIVTPFGYMGQLLLRGHSPACEVPVSFLYVPVWCVYKVTVVMCHMLKLCLPPGHSDFSHFFSLTPNFSNCLQPA